jgi:uncharacterized protein YlaI
MKHNNMKKETKYICKNCGHHLLKCINPKTNKVTWKHYNRFYFGATALNDKWCSFCEVSTIHERTFNMKEVCNKPKPII